MIGNTTSTAVRVVGVTSIVPWYVMYADLESLEDWQIEAATRLIAQEQRGRGMQEERAAA